MKVTTIPVGMLGTNCYLLACDQKNCAVIDPGAQPEKIAAIIEEEGLHLEYILLTHGHYDHIGGVNFLKQKYPNAMLYVGKHDMELLCDDNKNYAAIRSERPEDYILKDAKTLEEGTHLKLGDLDIEVIETPGHTKGGVTYICRDALFTGDTLFYSDVGRTDLYGGDYAALMQSLKKIALLKGDFLVYPGHGSSSTLDYERKNNYYLSQCM